MMTDAEVQAAIVEENERTARREAPKRAEAYAHMEKYHGPVGPGVPYDEMYRLIQLVSGAGFHWQSQGQDCPPEHTDETRLKQLEDAVWLVFWFADQHGMI